MRSREVLKLGLAALALAATAPAPSGAAEFHFASKQEGEVAAASADGWFEALGPFERSLRASNLERTSMDELRVQFRNSVQEWPQPVQSAVAASLGRLDAALAPFKPLLAVQVDLVFVDSTFEDGLPHTRGAAIFLPPVVGTIDTKLLDFVLAHEIFHVLTRTNPDVRDRLYETIGFHSCRLDPPPALASRHITNPDAPVDAHYVTISGVAYVPYVFGKDEPVTEPLQLNENLTTRLVAVDVADGRCKAQQSAKGDPILKKASDLPAFFDVVGRDSTYVSHPEELLADDFALLLTSPSTTRSPDMMGRLKQVLTSAAEKRAGGGAAPRH